MGDTGSLVSVRAVAEVQVQDEQAGVVPVDRQTGARVSDGSNGSAGGAGSAGTDGGVFDATRFAQIAAELHDQADEPDTIDAVLRYSVQASGATWASVVLLQHRGRFLEVAGATDDVARRADELQLEVGQGPYLNSTMVNDLDSVLVTRVDYEERWPEWAQAVYDLGIRGVLSVELGTSRHRLGALNLYSDRADCFSEADIEVARILAQHAAIALDRSRQQANLSRAVDSHANVGQAVGIVMERFGIDADKAFSVLRRYSQDANVKLREVAENLVKTRQLPPHE